MSVAEIIEEVKRMTPDERNEIQQALLALKESAQGSPRVRELGPDDPEFRAAADHVFTHYGDLLRRLAE